MMQRKYLRERRQLNDILSSVGNVAASFLSAQSVSLQIPTAIPSILGLQAASTTSDSRSSTSHLSPSSSTAQATISPSTNTSTPTSSLSTTPRSSKISTGLLAGASIGGAAVLILLGILIMLVLRHKRRKRQQHPLQPAYPSPTLEYGNSARSLDKTLVDRTPMSDYHLPVSAYPHPRDITVSGISTGDAGGEKYVYAARAQDDALLPVESELATPANVWELDGREKNMHVRPTELDSPMARVDESGWIGHGGRRSRGVRPEHDELHF